MNNAFRCKGRCVHREQYCKVILLGDLNAGKSSFFRKIHFTDPMLSAESLLGESCGIDMTKKDLTLRRGERIQVNLCDTGGIEGVRSSMVKNYYHHANAVILMYDMNAPDSVANLQGWLEDAKSNTNDNVTFMLVGNKMDMQKTRANQTLGDNFALINNIPDNLHFKISVKESSQDDLMAMIVSLVQHIHDNRREVDQNNNHRDSVRLNAQPLLGGNSQSRCCLK